jgi:hypothetical protein
MTISYSQRDVEWADDQLGSSPDLTVGQAGCLISSVASTLSDLTDRVIAPGELNQWLKKNGGFTGGGLFVWDSITSLGLRRAETISCATQPAPIKRLAEALASGAGVVVQVDAKPGGAPDQHWVRLLAVDDKDGQIMDPWQLAGKELIALSRYFASGWTPARAIFMAVVYSPVAAAGRGLRDEPRQLEQAQPEDAEHQPALCIRPKAHGAVGSSASRQKRTGSRKRAKSKTPPPQGETP